MIKSSLTALALILTTPVFAQAAPAVYPGCTVPSEVYSKTWWVDPVNGKTQAAGGLGTKEAPWDSLQGVMKPGWPQSGYTRPLLSTIPYWHVVNKARVYAADDIGATIHPGDLIMLMSGNYGNIAPGDYNKEVANSNFVTIKAAPGQNPVFNYLYLRSTNKWVFDGIKVQSKMDSSRLALVSVFDQGSTMPTTDIILTNMDISTFDAAPVDFTQANWLAQGRSGFQTIGKAGDGHNGMPYTTCISMTNSHIHHVLFGVSFMSNNSLFDHNEIDNFGDDGLDYAANNISMTNNYFHDNFGLADGIHNDAMQGQNGPLPVGVPFNHFSNIVIIGNKIIRQTDPNLKFPSYLQGIDAFDQEWTNVSVLNNIIVTTSCWGINFSSVHDGLFAGNTVLHEGAFETPGCSVMLAVGGKTHQGPSSTNVRVTNNLAQKFGIGANGDVNVTYDNNFALLGAGFAGWDFVNKKQSYYNNPQGIDANGNYSTKLNVPTPYTDVFENWSPKTYTYDLHIKSTSPTFGRGTGVPMTNIENKMRIPPLSLGAY